VKKMTTARLQELEEMETKLQATARALPSGPDRHDILQEIGTFRERIVALQDADLQPARGLKVKQE
jgi:Mg2+ and Co2+ transporter CorA